MTDTNYTFFFTLKNTPLIVATFETCTLFEDFGDFPNPCFLKRALPTMVVLETVVTVRMHQVAPHVKQLEMLLIPNALCWSSRKCNCACALPAEVQLRLRVTRRSWQKLFAGKNFVKILVTAQTQLRSYSEQQRAFGNSNICNCFSFSLSWPFKLRRFFRLFMKDQNFLLDSAQVSLIYFL